MKIPDKLKIGGHQYKVIFPYHFKELNSAHGQHDATVNEIRINDLDSAGIKRADSQISVTLIHEIMHALDRLTGQDRLGDSDNSEKYLACLAEMIYQFLTDNGFLK